MVKYIWDKLIKQWQIHLYPTYLFRVFNALVYILNIQGESIAGLGKLPTSPWDKIGPWSLFLYNLQAVFITFFKKLRRWCIQAGGEEKEEEGWRGKKGNM